MKASVSVHSLLMRSLLLALCTLSFSANAASAAVVSAGQNQTLAFPANTITLFGSTGTSTPRTIGWSLVNGPAPVVFSAPYSLTTTVSFAATGIYTIGLTVDDGTQVTTATMTATILSADRQTAFYVDPDYVGSVRD